MQTYVPYEDCPHLGEVDKKDSCLGHPGDKTNMSLLELPEEIFVAILDRLPLSSIHKVSI